MRVSAAPSALFLVPYIELPQQWCQRFGKSLHGKLAGAVYTVEGDTSNTAHAADIDDVSFLVRLHFRQDGLCQAHGAEKVAVEAALNRLHCHAFERSKQADARVIDCHEEENDYGEQKIGAQTGNKYIERTRGRMRA